MIFCNIADITIIDHIYIFCIDSYYIKKNVFEEMQN